MLMAEGENKALAVWSTDTETDDFYSYFYKCIFTEACTSHFFLRPIMSFKLTKENLVELQRRHYCLNESKKNMI